MGSASRAKGLTGEREVRAVFESHGFTVRGLEGEGDHLAFGHGVSLHSESKRQEVARVWLWAEQATAEMPAGVDAWIVPFRRSHGRWLALVDFEDHLGLLARG